MSKTEVDRTLRLKAVRWNGVKIYKAKIVRIGILPYGKEECELLYVTLEKVSTKVAIYVSRNR